MVWMNRMKRAVVLLSGGLDSATVLAMARADGYACHALSFRYGQRHVVEIEAAARVAHALGAVGEMGGDIPITYVPARSALFLCHALAWAEVLGARDLYAGMNALDYSGYPDCRPEFLAAFETMASLGTKAGAEGAEWRVRAPLIAMTKAEIIRAGVALGVDYSLTHSCYDP